MLVGGDRQGGGARNRWGGIYGDYAAAVAEFLH